jgi:hypothetical protein
MCNGRHWCVYRQLKTSAVLQDSTIGVPDMQRNIVVIAHVLAWVLCYATESIRGHAKSWISVDDEPIL